MLELYHACCQTGHELLLEIIPPPDDKASVGESVCKSVRRVYELGIRPDWWKIPCMERASVEQMSALIDEHAPHCRGIVVLGLDAPLEVLGEGFKAFSGIERVKGFAVGRSIFGQPSRQWFANELTDEQLIEEVSDNYSTVIDLWNAR